MDDGLNIATGPEGLRVNFEAAARRIIKVDVERYQAYLNGTSMTDQQKRDFLQAMWLVMISFVELGFEVHPIQDACGKNAVTSKEFTTRELDTLGLGKPQEDEREQDPRP
jgi:hypothetical protein